LHSRTIQWTPYDEFDFVGGREQQALAAGYEHLVDRLRAAAATGDGFTRMLRFMLGMMLGVAVLSGISSARKARPPPPTPIIYSDFLRCVKQNRVRAVRFEVRFVGAMVRRIGV
jgi:hypothetical protein